MTLFGAVAGESEVFLVALRKYFRGEMDQKTIERL